MVVKTGITMTIRFFLVSPKDLAATAMIACAKAAVAAGDCASIIVHENIKQEEVAELQELGLAVLIADVEPRIVSHRRADGLHVSTTEFNLLDLRMSLPKDAMVGLDCGTSRHAAMEASEQGADYVAFRQKAQTVGEPLIKWWNDLAEIPAVPFDPVNLADAVILAQNSDFIRPSDDMWQGPEMATTVISELATKLK
jgi:thiamine-phosphate pyrophosphorylase